jgi:hypothetical protein
VTSASHDLALAWLPVSSSSSPLLSLSLFRRTYTTQTELFTQVFRSMGVVIRRWVCVERFGVDLGRWVEGEGLGMGFIIQGFV